MDMVEANTNPSELVEKRDALLKLKEAIDNRTAGLSKEEALEVESLSRRALNPECAFDRKYSSMLYRLALAPAEVGWYFKFRERFHRLAHHH
jgi:hypothetical protein